MTGQHSPEIWRFARQVAQSDPVLTTFAAPEFDELNDDGKAWIVAIVHETLARAASGQAPAV